MTWLRALWQRWVARKMPPDDDVDSEFLRTTAINMQVPGEQTHTDLMANYPTKLVSSDDTAKWLEK